jgi:hypothetical protein
MQASLAITTLDIDGEGKTIVGLAEKKLKLLRRKDSSRIKDRQNTGK